MWYEKEFDPAFVEEVKEQVKKKNEYLNYNNLAKNYETRWIGHLGELTFAEWLDNHGFVKNIHYKHWADFVEVDKRDFTLIGTGLEIDVKTTGTSYYPKEGYGCNISPRQHSKTGFNSYVFARYILDKNICVLMGWITKEEFDIQKVIRRKGEELNKFIPKSDFFEISIRNLRGLGELTML